MANTYKDAGVDVAAGDKLVDWLIKSNTSQPAPTSLNALSSPTNVVSGIGGFASLYRAQFQDMKSPCLVSATDGVGTKVKLAAEFSRYEGIGQDLVAMCVNDLVCVGAKPLFFLDYYATGRLELDVAKTFLTSVRRACDDSDCVLIGGETAEMPGIYAGKDFDCAGFAVGVVDEPDVLGAKKVAVGDRIIGVESSGFHSNGYSLVRRTFAKDIQDWIDILLKPTFLYVRLVQKILQNYKEDLHAVAHVTGGGFDNLLRVVPEYTKLSLNPWPIADIFLEVKKRENMDWQNLLTTFNCGVGLVMFVSEKNFQNVFSTVTAQGFKAYDLGVVDSCIQKESLWTVDYNKL